MIKTISQKSARIFSVAITLLVSSLLFVSCEKDDMDLKDPSDSILPDRFRVEIPGAISSRAHTKSQQVDTLSGDGVYMHLRNFIGLAESGAELNENVILMIAVNNLNRPMELTFISDEDGRAKHLSVVENASFEGKDWQYRLTVTDVGNPAKTSAPTHALQVFWNLAPLEAISILNPWNINRNTEEIYQETNFRVEYSETGALGYEAHMMVSFTGFPVPNPLHDPYGLSKMKMFVGRNGDMVSIFGNSEHPNARFFNHETGFNWAFSAAASRTQNIAVAEVGLPPMDLNASDRETLLETYSIYNVFRNQILYVWPNINPDVLEAYLHHTQAPGYFNAGGFVQAGTAPSQAYEPLKEAMEMLTPYNPATILNYQITFAQ